MGRAPRVTLKYPYAITVDGRRRRVASGAAQILFALMTHRESSLEDLVQTVWSGNTIRPVGTRSIINLYICELRRMLKGHWRIVNRFSHGWRLEEDADA